MLRGLKGRLAREARTNSKEKGSSKKSPPLKTGCHSLYTSGLSFLSKEDGSCQSSCDPLPATIEEQLAGWSLQALENLRSCVPYPGQPHTSFPSGV